MANYRFEDLGPRAFEQMAVSLACSVFGADIEVYGSGRDRGREATWTGRYNGALAWPGASSKVWTGYTVIQAKHKEVDQDPSHNLQWLKRQMAAEFGAWMDRADRGEQVPRNLLFVTNARLSADSGVDDVRSFIQSQLDKNYGTDENPRTLRGRGTVESAVWHRDELSTVLDKNDSVRNAYPALLTAGDVLAKIKVLPGDIDPEELSPALLGHARSALANERWVRFSEASDTNQKQSIDALIIDLPTTDQEGQRSRAILDCLSRGDRNLRRSQWRPNTPRHVVITGAPGNGKSTISSFVAQAYRALFLESDQSSPSEVRLGLGPKLALDRIGVPQPQVMRWPIRVDLADMAAKMGPSGGPNLMRYLCDRISERCDITLQPIALGRWLKGWPSAVIFDGLDEVTSPEARSRVLAEIEEFIARADREDWDLFAIMTTRPTGYTERFMPGDFQQIDLAFLEPPTAIAYAEHVTRLRLADDLQHAEGLLTRFREATHDDAIARLILTPLQVLMLTFILEHGTVLAANRYQLFWSYYLAVFRREAGKETALRAFFAEYEEVIADLHSRAGLLLHLRCEESGDTRPRLPRAELAQIARERFTDIGIHAEVALNSAVNKLLDIAHTRLILLVADESETVSFEVRSLQEVMAARALANGSDDQIADNLTVTAPSPHWRNVWLFAAGRLFEVGDHQRDLVLEVIENLDAGAGGFGWLWPVAPSLAADLIDDGVAASKPRWLRRLAAVVTRAVDGPMPDDPHTIAQALGRAAKQDRDAAHQIRETVKAALKGGLKTFEVAALIASYGTLGPIPGALSASEATRFQEAWLDSTTGAAQVGTVSRVLLAKLQELAGDQLGPAESMVAEAFSECAELRIARTEQGWIVPGRSWSTHKPSPHIRAVAENADALGILRLCLDDLGPDHWPARTLIAHAFYLECFRRPVGELLNLPYLRPRSAVGPAGSA